MSDEQTRENIAEDVNRMFNAMHCEKIVKRIPDSGLRQKICRHLSAKYEVPDRQDYSEKGTVTTLVSCRLMEDARASRDDRTELRNFLVGLLTEAIMSCEGVAAAPEQQAAAESKVSGQETMTLDIRRELAAEQSGPARFAGGPPDLTLFPQERAASPEIPLDYLSLLGPPPPLSSGEKPLGDWFSGIPADPSVFAFGMELDERGHERLADMEAEFLSSPKIMLDRYGKTETLKRPSAPEGGATSQDRLAGMALQAGDTTSSDLEILRAFRDSVARTLREVWPEQAEGLAGVGATLRTGRDLMQMLRQAWSLEEFWLDEFGGALEGKEQIILGCPHPDHAMEPGLLFRRAAFLHLLSGDHMSDSLLEAARELRCSMALRGHDHDDEQTMHIVTTFDTLFEGDCTRPLSAYKFANNEMESAL
ncbi:hypothetical protein [Leisingera sp. XS_AS12]|uniref:hypothetical protein n=1 Tax=Leisingera sp. XS_AS12 TaxID=3241294 RepID=UPI003517A54E